jgi:folate-dependent phosphoribosylglycinamide formyltransferase PurN
VSKRYKIGWFSTGRGEGSKGLLKAAQESIQSGEIDAEIEFIYCTRERGETEATDAYLDMAAGYGIPVVNFSYRKYRETRNMPTPDPSQPMPQWRIDHDREVMKLLEGYSPDLCVLAGFMIIAGPEMCEKYAMLNLHPAAPDGPAGTWQQVIWKLIETKADTQGVKMHVAIPELDVGPTASFCTFSIQGKAFDHLWKEIEGMSVDEIKEKQGVESPLFQTIRQHGFVRETPLILATIKAFSEGKVKITDDRQVVDVSGKPIEGYDLSTEIDEMVKDKLQLTPR